MRYIKRGKIPTYNVELCRSRVICHNVNRRTLIASTICRGDADYGEVTSGHTFLKDYSIFLPQNTRCGPTSYFAYQSYFFAKFDCFIGRNPQNSRGDWRENIYVVYNINSILTLGEK